MRIRILPSAPDHPRLHQFLTTYLVNDTLAIDAGALGLHGDPGEQARIGHVFLTHSHADHLLSLPLFVANVCDQRHDSVVVHAHRQVLDALRTDVFNGRIWPDFLAGSRDGIPFVTLDELEPERPVAVDGLSVTPVPVDHVVPTFGYIVDDGASAVVFASDTGPTERIWQVAGGVDHLRAVFIDAAFPDDMGALARSSAHLTPRLLAREVAKIPRHVTVVANHINPRYRKRVVAELEALGLPGLTVAACDEEYEL